MRLNQPIYHPNDDEGSSGSPTPLSLDPPSSTTLPLESVKESSYERVWPYDLMVLVLFLGYGVMPWAASYFAKDVLGIESLSALIVIQQFTTLVSWACILIGLNRYYKVSVPKLIGLKVDTSYKVVLGWSVVTVVLTLAVAIGVEAFGKLIDLPVDQPYSQFSRGELQVLSFFAVLIAPMMEELVFRGLVQTTLRWYVSSGWAIVITALIFVFAHVMYYQTWLVMVYVFLLALIFSWVREASGSLIPGIIAHTFNNTMAALLLAVYWPAPF